MKARFRLPVQRPILLPGSRVVAAAAPISAIDPIQPVAAQDEARRRECSLVQAA
jgi:hypothetical protein